MTLRDNIGEQRISRSARDWTYRVHARNDGGAAANHVQAVLASAPAGRTIIDGKVLAGSIDGGATVRRADRIPGACASLKPDKLHINKGQPSHRQVSPRTHPCRTLQRSTGFQTGPLGS